jgi:DNA-binding MarR family transcriptional regulator
MSSKDAPIQIRLGQVVQSYQAAVDDFDREIARLLGVNETDLRCLELLIEAEATTPGRLAARLGLSTGSVTALIDRLEGLGYLARSAHPGDRRKTLVSITPQASELTYGLIAPFLDDGRRILSRYTPEQLELVAGFLVATRENQREHVERLRRLPAVRTRRRAAATSRSAPGRSDPASD